MFLFIEISGGSWSPEINDQMQYLEINFVKSIPIFGVIMQGSPIFDQYITSFKILYSSEGLAFHYLVDETNTPQVFSGPIDSRTPVKSMFKIPIEAKVIRIYPLTWHGSIAVRVELLGCSPNKAIEIDIEHHEEIDIKPICDDPLGIENAQLHSNQITLSSYKTSQSEDTAKKSLKLSSNIGWQPNLDSPNEYVAINFNQLRNVTGIRTKGGENCWIKAYTILYSDSNVVLNADGSDEQLFLGNFDSNSEKTNYFRFPIQTQKIKIIPKSWHNCIEMKIEPIGCFIPYEHETEHIEIVTLPSIDSLSCDVCPGITTQPHLIEGICPCKQSQFWNGIECVSRNMCPCVVNHLTYGVGAQFEMDDCSQCTCVLGGLAQCKQRECAPCEKGLRRIQSKTTSCLCLCEPCAANEILCQTSGVCIPESSWCNGIQDCPDDEINCSYKQKTQRKTIRKEKIIITETCSSPKCPPGFYVKINKSKKVKSPSLFNNAAANDIDGIYKNSNENMDQSILPMPNNLSKKKRKHDFDDCVEYDCIPEKPITISKTEKLFCQEPSCPSGYKVIFAEKSHSSLTCAKYKCELIPQNDAVCNITGRTFNTFDGIEFKYDVCDHILARDLLANNWTISRKCFLPYANASLNFFDEMRSFLYFSFIYSISSSEELLSWKFCLLKTNDNC